MSAGVVNHFPFAENGARIRRARNRTGLSQERFAPIVGTSRRHMIRLENGEHLPGENLRDRIVEVTRTDERIRAEDEEEEEALCAALLRNLGYRPATQDGLLASPTMHTVRDLRRMGLGHLAQAQELERRLS